MSKIDHYDPRDEHWKQWVKAELESLYNSLNGRIVGLESNIRQLSLQVAENIPFCEPTPCLHERTFVKGSDPTKKECFICSKTWRMEWIEDTKS